MWGCQSVAVSEFLNEFLNEWHKQPLKRVVIGSTCRIFYANITCSAVLSYLEIAIALDKN